MRLVRRESNPVCTGAASSAVRKLVSAAAVALLGGLSSAHAADAAA